MSWTTGSNKNSYVVTKPNLEQLIGEDEYPNVLIIYQKWCNQVLTVRFTSIALIFFAFGMFGIYLINLPIYLFGLHKFDYFSFSGLWNVICMVSIFTIHLYANSLNFNILNHKKSRKLQSKVWSFIFPLISYPFCALCFSSFYLQWLEIPFLSSPTASSANIHNTIFQYSIFLLSYVYGYFPYHVINCNKIYFKSMQLNRTLFFKQLLLKIFISNFIQTTIYCLCMLIFCRKTNIFFTLFVITFNINFLYLMGHNILNRLLTEHINYPLINNLIKNNRYNIDIRLLSLTRSSIASLNTNPNEIELFFYFSLINLLDIVQFDVKQRKIIYSKQVYFNIIADTLLYEFNTFIISIYEYIYGEKYKKLNEKYNNSFFNKFYYKYFILKPEINVIFNNYEKLIYAADILSYLVVHSLQEDELGNVQESLEKILCVLLECLDILDIFIKSNVYKDIYQEKAKGIKNKIVNYIYKGIQTALMRIVIKMYNYLELLKLPQKNAARLQTYLDHI